MKANAEIIQKIETYETADVTGYRIVTDKQIIDFNVEKNGTFSGILIVPPDTDFVQKAVVRISKGEKPMMVLSAVAAILGYEGKAVLVDIETSKGTLQLVAYNQHDGSAVRTVSFKSMKLKFKDKI